MDESILPSNEALLFSYWMLIKDEAEIARNLETDTNEESILEHWKRFVTKGNCYE